MDEATKAARDVMHAESRTVKNLLEVALPEGAIAGFDIGWKGWTGSNRHDWISAMQGYDGIRFIGAGRDKTHILPFHDNVTSGDSTILIGFDAKHVEFESLTIHVGPRKGIHVGWEVPQGIPHTHTTRLRDVAIVADDPGGKSRGVWGLFTYQSFVDCEDVEFFCSELAEHAFYAHGYGAPGVRWVGVTVHGSGAEGFKATARPWECAHVPQPLILIEGCIFKDWHQPWSWRGGAGATFQGTGANVSCRDSLFYGGDGGGYCRAFMVDDNIPIGGLDPNVKRGGYYSAIDGEPNQGPANGWIVLERCGMTGRGAPHYSPMLRLGTLNPEAPADSVARGLLVSECGLYGEYTKAEIGGVMNDMVYVSGSNTEKIRSAVEGVGFDTEHETVLAYGGRWMPISRGVSKK